MTQRLYHADAYQRRFEATVVAHATHAGRRAIALDATAFYPEAGGQLGDRGTIGSLAVVDTQEDDAGRILHVVGDGELPAIGAAIAGEIDWARRRQHMAQHTAQHLLSGALLDRAAAPTASARLGESALTIDVARDRIPEAEIAAAEDLANDLIDDDLAIRAWFPAADELAALKLRRDPKVDADIRVVAIGDFDFSPCGGTHVARTSALGALRVVATERYKGMTRVTFTAARRGRTELFARDSVLRGLAAQLSCGVLDVPAAFAKLRATATETDAELTRVRGRLAELIAHQLGAATPSGPIVAEVPGDAVLLRAVAAKLVTAGRDALLCARDADGVAVVLFRAEGSTIDCGALWKQALARAGGTGRGGGRADRAEGRIIGTVADWPSLVCS